MASARKGGFDTAASGLPRAYGRARRFAVRGRQTQARRILAALRTKSEDVRLQALIANDLAVLAALDGPIRGGARAGRPHWISTATVFPPG